MPSLYKALFGLLSDTVDLRRCCGARIYTLTMMKHYPTARLVRHCRPAPLLIIAVAPLSLCTVCAASSSLLSLLYYYLHTRYLHAILIICTRRALPLPPVASSTLAPPRATRYRCHTPPPRARGGELGRKALRRGHTWRRLRRTDRRGNRRRA